MRCGCGGGETRARGVQYIADLFGCDPATIRHGAQDIEQLPEDEAIGRIPIMGDRKSASIAQPELVPPK